MRALVAIAVLAAVVMVGVSLFTGNRQETPKTVTTSASRTATLRSVPAPRLTARQINRQDRPDRRRQRDEAHVFDCRPLLSVLPMTFESVRFAIGGLAADGRTTIIRGNASGLGWRRARIAYDTLRRRTGDRSSSYRLEIHP